MNSGAFLGVTVGSFIIPAAVFWVFFRWARNSANWRAAKLIAGWLLGLILIYASTLPAGRGFFEGLTVGHILALLLGAFLTYHAFTPTIRES